MAQLSRSLFNVFLLLALVSSVLSVPAGGPNGSPGKPKKCKSLEIRKEWRDLSKKQRIAYTDAVRCFNRLPSQDPSKGTVSRLDDFSLAHVQKTPVVHFVGQFLPWHRYFVRLFAKALREECGYKGPTPYWDWTKDAHSKKPFHKSEIFDPVHGFGGNGVPGTYTLPPDPNNELEIPEFEGNPDPPALWNGCVQDGPFNDREFRINIGPGRQFTNHCIVRTFNPTNWTDWITRDRVKLAMDAKTYAEHWPLVFSGPHLGGHAIIGGVMSNGFSTPGDPLFYAHHAAVDRLWWNWQQAKPKQRLYEISGPTLADGSESPEATLDYVLEFPGLSANLTIKDVMDIRVEPNCYTYQ